MTVGASDMRTDLPSWRSLLFVPVTAEKFIRTGADLDHLHPNCSDPTITASTTCYPRSLGFNGDLLQIMPWPGLRHSAEHDLRAIYEYLSAIPCIEGPPAPDPRQNDCS